MSDRETLDLLSGQHGYLYSLLCVACSAVETKGAFVKVLKFSARGFYRARCSTF